MEPKTVRAFGQVQTSVLISREFYDMCKKLHIRFSEAMRTGISVLAAERGVIPYDNNLNLFRRMMGLKTQLEEISAKYFALKEKEDARKPKDQ